MRKAISLLKKFLPDILVAEFQYTSQFRDRDSNMDTILTQVVSHSAHTQVIALVEEEQKLHFERLQSRFDNIRKAVYFPLQDADIKHTIHELLG
jgi:non-ribosomal peptide synthetase component E (peptide arylation enzyme)